MSSEGRSSTVSDGFASEDLTFDGRDTAAYTTPHLNFSYAPYAGGLAVRLDTFIGARFGRTTLIPADTTRVLIRRTARSFRPHATAHVRRTTVDRPRQVARLVRAANRLRGSLTVPFLASCPMMVVQRTYVVRFTGPSGTFTLSGQDGPCWQQLTLRHDGVKVPPTLDPGSGWFDELDGLLPRS